MPVGLAAAEMAIVHELAQPIADRARRAHFVAAVAEQLSTTSSAWICRGASDRARTATSIFRPADRPEDRPEPAAGLRALRRPLPPAAG